MSDHIDTPDNPIHGMRALSAEEIQRAKEAQAQQASDTGEAARALAQAYGETDAYRAEQKRADQQHAQEQISQALAAEQQTLEQQNPIKAAAEKAATAAIPIVPAAAPRFGGTEITSVPSTAPVSVATTTLPVVGRGAGGRWGVRSLKSFVQVAPAAPPAAPRGRARIQQPQFALKSSEEKRRAEARRKEALRREKEYARDTLNFTLRLAEAMFHYGADAVDVDSAIIAVCSAYGLDSVDVDITNQSVTINYTSDPDIYMESRIIKRNTSSEERFTHTLVRVVRSSTENSEALAATYRLIHDITQGGINLDIADLKLSEITNGRKLYAPAVVWLANIICAGTLTAALGASWATSIAAAIIFIPVYLIMSRLASIGMASFFRMAVGAGITTLLAIMLGGDGSFLHRPGVSISAPLVVAAGLIMFLPTPRLVAAVQDAINGFPVTAAGRFVSTGMSFVGLVVGIATAVSILALFGWPMLDIAQTRFEPAPPWIWATFMIIATVAWAVAIQTSWQKCLLVAAITACGLGTYYWVQMLSGEGTGRAATAAAAFVIGALSTYTAYKLHAPQAIFSIPALTFLLPGLSFFRGMYLLTVETDVVVGVQNAVTAVSLVLAMAAGVALGNYVMQYVMQHVSVWRVDRRQEMRAKS